MGEVDVGRAFGSTLGADQLAQYRAARIVVDVVEGELEAAVRLSQVFSSRACEACPYTAVGHLAQETFPHTRACERDVPDADGRRFS